MAQGSAGGRIPVYFNPFSVVPAHCVESTRHYPLWKTPKVQILSFKIFLDSSARRKAMSDAAAGLGAFGFWIFIAAIVVAGIWYDARRKESQQETLRRVVESGREISPEMIDRLMGVNWSGETERDLKVAALIVLAIAPGMFILSLFLGSISAEARVAVMGASVLVAFIGAGLGLAAKLVSRTNNEK
jgi:hypothetical protein